MGTIFSISVPLDGLFSYCFNRISVRANYVRKLDINFHALTSAIEELTALKNDVKRRVRVAEANQLTPLDQVQRWISSVEAAELEIHEVIRGAAQEIEKLCLGGWCSTNFKSSYKFGKKVVQKLESVANLKREGVFEVVADMTPSASVEPRPSEPTVGLESMFDKVWRCLGEEDVGIVGLFGLGGVGKTTLLSQINNRFLNTPSDFDFVIWAVVSKDLNLAMVQDIIGNRIGFLADNWKQKSCDEKATDIFKVLSKKKFILLLDDVWERVDLKELGVPIPYSTNNCKLVFTTRSKEVCGLMEAQRMIEVECLPWEKAWKLFREKVGDEALKTHPDIPKLAESVAKECDGLPLALITVGRAMASKNTPEQWKHAIDMLRNSASKFTGIKEKVFAPLKFTFDNLQGKYRSCFLYFALFPEDFLISKDKLLHYWIGEGYLDESNEIDKLRNEGYYIIGTLLDACLLEEEGGSVKMHDVVRDMAIWIVSENDKENNDYFVVQAGAGLAEAPETQNWGGAKKVSLMENKILYFTEIPLCSNVTTFFLNYNNLLEIRDGVLDHMPNLRVLDLSFNMTMKDLPMGISRLVSLQYLNLSYTIISELPIELRSLVNLKYLNLFHTKYLNMIPRRVISSFSKLQVCKIAGLRSDLESDVEDSVALSYVNEALVEELEGLKYLQFLDITIQSETAMQRYFRSNKLQSYTRCLQLNYIETSRVFNISSLHNVKNLDKLLIRCFKVQEFKIDWIEAMRSKTLFVSLRVVFIHSCHKLRDLTWLVCAPNITSLNLYACNELEEVISVEKLNEAIEEAANLKPFSQLKVLSLKSLPRLKSIYPGILSFSYLENISVFGCSDLKRLPLNSNGVEGRRKKITIKGEKLWWDAINWEDEATQNAFTFLEATQIV